MSAIDQSRPPQADEGAVRAVVGGACSSTLILTGTRAECHDCGVQHYPGSFDRAIDALCEWRRMPDVALWQAICRSQARRIAAERTRTSTPVGN